MTSQQSCFVERLSEKKADSNYCYHEYTYGIAYFESPKSQFPQQKKDKYFKT